MKPDRSNYEIWLLDWFDGNLSEAQIIQLKEFLDINPDLREEADTYFHSRLFPDDSLYPNTKSLKKTPAQLHTAQLEYLAAAYHENDLSADQVKELFESMEHNEEKREIFNAFSRLKLIPPDLIYPRKGALFHKTKATRVLRISVNILSVAAGISLLVLAYFYIPRFVTDKNERRASGVRPDSVRNQPVEILIQKPVAVSVQTEPSSGSRNNLFRVPAGENKAVEINQVFASAAVDTSSFSREITRIAPVKVIMISEIPLDLKPPGSNLIATNITLTESLSTYDDGRSRFSKFIARSFREKILKADTLNEAPLKTYEIAEAGIKGLNKLFGWQMALQKTYDKSGELKSIYFSSRILKFNAPVRKSTPAP